MNVDSRIIESIKQCLKENEQSHLESEFIKLINNYVVGNYDLDDILNLIEHINTNSIFKEEDNEN